MPTCVVGAYSSVAAHRAGVVVRRAHERVAQVGVRVDLQHRQPGMLRGDRRDHRRRDRVLAAEDRPETCRASTISAATRRISRIDLVHRRERKLHLRQREDADAVDVGLRLLVPQLHVRRGDEDLVRAVARARHVGRGAVERNRQDDDAGVVEIGRWSASCRRTRRRSIWSYSNGRFIHFLEALVAERSGRRWS